MFSRWDDHDWNRIAVWYPAPQHMGLLVILQITPIIGLCSVFASTYPTVRPCNLLRPHRTSRCIKCGHLAMPCKSKTRHIITLPNFVWFEKTYLENSIRWRPISEMVNLELPRNGGGQFRHLHLSMEGLTIPWKSSRPLTKIVPYNYWWNKSLVK